MRESLLADRLFFERGNIGNNHNHFTRFLSFLRCFNFSSPWVELDQTRFARLRYPFSDLFCYIDGRCTRSAGPRYNIDDRVSKEEARPARSHESYKHFPSVCWYSSQLRYTL